MIYALYILIIYVFVRLFYYFYYYIKAKKVLDRYENYLENQNDWYISDNRQMIVDMLKKAGIINAQFPYVEYVGFQQVCNSTLSLFNNIATLREDIVRVVHRDLREAKTVFRSRLLATFNPVFYLEIVIYLPKLILEYLGVKKESVVIKLVQTLWWLLQIAGILVGIIFNKRFVDWLNKLMSNL